MVGDIRSHGLGSNYLLAEARLKSLVNDLQKDEATMQKYNEIIQKLIDDDIVEEADNSKEYLQGESVITHYLPHHMVQGNDGKNLRVVYEGCTKTHKSKRSLNECLHPGKNLVANLCGILLRFRMKRIAFVADIEKAYLQLELNPSDRDVTRFLWLKDVKKPLSKDNIRELRFCRVIWGIISSAFLLASTIMYHLMSYNTPVAQDISSNLYVDNLISGTDSVCSAKDYYDETKMIFNKAAMNMCKWVCNDDTVMTHYKDEDKVNETEVKVLGMLWRVNTDALYFHKPNIIDPEVVSKRSILKAISAVYDPLGLVSPILLQPKLLLQSLWKKKIDCDKEIPKECMKVWRKFKDDLFYIGKIRIERPINSGIPHYKTIQLVTFTDASKNAYAATVYLKTSNEISSKVKLVFSKTRISPIKSILTIPRLELMSVLVGCRASQFVSHQLNIKDLKQTLFTDSKCVIGWCKTEKPLNRFVLGRVKEIRDSRIAIAYVQSAENPADIASRGETAERLKESKLWWNGPGWLSTSTEEIYIQDYEVNEEIRTAVLNEMKEANSLLEVSLVSNDIVEAVESPFNLNETKYSSYWKLVHVSARCLRFIHNCKGSELITGPLFPKEIEEGRNLWLRFIQQKHFPKDNGSATRDLGVYSDEKIMDL